ncbi:unnamed protein product [Cuscuta epithymum]|uniref:Uncharacterized protein n=1 Tax=Cuscuta epithymum TaxID=186058 RepID=A0AAV0E946_9ASTE|nr:unnamed protein product [Cuscuta epithymum]
MSRDKVGPDGLPDIRLQGKGTSHFSLTQVCSAGLDHEMTVSSALNLAVFISMLRPIALTSAYMLTGLVKDPNPSAGGKVSSRLRWPKLYNYDAIWELGKYLFDDSFIVTLQSILRNLLPQSGKSEASVACDIWYYLRSRYGEKRKCPVDGALPELIEHLRKAPKGWTLYYWARISIGKWHYAAQNGILAPIAAGEEADLISALKKFVRKRVDHYAAVYSAKYKDQYKEFKDSKPDSDIDEEIEKRLANEENPRVAKYVPPHLRRMQHLEAIFEEYDDLSSVSGTSKEAFERLAMAQVRHKLFKGIEVKSYDRIVTVGVTNDAMRELIIDSYQARWISLDRCIRKAKSRGKVFKLGGVPIEEHPWGELRTEFPDTLEGVREMARQLHHIGWTVDPDKMWEKLEKSISELWEDLTKELNTALSFIEESGIDSLDEQAYANISKRSKEAVNHMRLTQVINLPAFGYTPPYILPKKTVVVERARGRVLQEYTVVDTTAAAEQPHDGEGKNEDDGWNEIEDETVTLSS